jgi:hypothetical protein
MIYRIALSDLTRKRFTDIVMLQLRLLNYAAGRRKLTENGCADFLNKSRRFRGRGEQIARWLWRGPKRLRLIKSFAEGAASAVKLPWVQELSNDVIRLLRQGPTGALHPQDYDRAPGWQKSGSDFLRKFYADWYERGFPGCFFSEDIDEPFTRHDFIEAFEGINAELHVCAACDDATAISGQEGNRKSSIDHYFPKELYPHLVLHPFNLIPGCHFCNSAKGSNDVTGHPGRRRDLREVVLPYREPGLVESTYLQAKFKGATIDVRFGQLRPLRRMNVQSRIDAFSEVYNIPDRWGGSVNRIGDKLFRTMKQFHRANPRAVKGPVGLLAFLEYMLEIFRRENLGKDPYTFAMSCWLERILTNVVRPVVKGSAGPTAEQRVLCVQQQLEVKLTRR